MSKNAATATAPLTDAQRIERLEVLAGQMPALVQQAAQQAAAETIRHLQLVPPLAPAPQAAPAQPQAAPAQPQAAQPFLQLVSPIQGSVFDPWKNAWNSHTVGNYILVGTSLLGVAAGGALIVQGVATLAGAEDWKILTRMFG